LGSGSYFKRCEEQNIDMEKLEENKKNLRMIQEGEGRRGRK